MRSAPANTTPCTAPVRATRNALVAVVALRPQNIEPATVVDPARVQVHIRPVSVAVSVVVPTSVRAAVAGAQVSVPRSPVRVVAAPVVVTVEWNVPVWSRMLVIVPLALAIVPVPESRAYSAFLCPGFRVAMRNAGVESPG